MAFVAGALASAPGVAATAGAATCAGEVVGYYLTAAARGLPFSESTVLFWIVCGLSAGPVLAVAGHGWRVGSARTRLAAGGVLAMCFLLEALRYAVVLHYGSTAALFAAFGVMVLAPSAAFSSRTTSVDMDSTRGDAR